MLNRVQSSVCSMACFTCFSAAEPPRVLGRDSWDLQESEYDEGEIEEYKLADKEKYSKSEVKRIFKVKNMKFRSSKFTILLTKSSIRRSDLKKQFFQMKSQPTIEALFRRYRGPNKVINAKMLSRFYIEEQGEEKSEEDCEYELRGRPKKGLDKDDFIRLLFSYKNVVYKKDSRMVTQDMSRPLSDYFIASSHNTYLFELNQLNSRSHFVGVGNALRIGAKLIELDCMDGKDGEPIVTHKKSFVTSIPFAECIQEIKDFKDQYPQRKYPIIITLENYCSHEQQHRQVEIMRKAFGKNLLHTTSFENDEGKFGFSELKGPLQWKSPDELANKIIIRDRPWKVKRNARKNGSGSTPGERTVGTTHSEPRGQLTSIGGSASDSGRAPKKKSTGSLFKKKRGKKPSSSTLVSVESQELERTNTIVTDYDGASVVTDYEYDPAAGKKIKNKRSDELLGYLYIRNVNIERNPKGKGADYFLDQSPECGLTSSSMPHSDLVAYYKDKNATNGMVHYSRRNLVRVYPKLGLDNVYSSNYNPMPAWILGCQMVALNYQKHDEYLWLNHGLFSKNGRCGYVLKPECLLVGDDINGEHIGYNNSLIKKKPQKEVTRDFSPRYLPEHIPVGGIGEFSVTLISGHYLPKPASWLEDPVKSKNRVTDTYVEVIFYSPIGTMKPGVDALGKEFKQSHTSKTVRGNGLSPVWNETFHFHVKNVQLEKELSVLMFVVRERSNKEVMGQYAIPFDCIRQGFRVVPLRNADCSRIQDGRQLFCKFNLPSFML